MKKLNSISLMLMGTGFLVLALFMTNIYLQSSLLVASIILNVIAAVKSFKEKKQNKF